MTQFARTRTREREPGGEDIYEQNMRLQLAIRDMSLTGKVVIRGADRPWQQTRQGRLRFYLCRGVLADAPLKDWHCFVLDVQRHSGKHKHQGGLCIFVLEGEGYSVIDGERIDWQAGDLICLPIKPGGCEHQHFNRHAEQPCKWVAFIYKPLHDEVASYIEQKEPSPEFQAS
jgi:hypothetical protein